MSVLQAPVGAIDRMRRPLRFGHVLVTLEDLLIVTWTISEAALRRDLPPMLQPVVREGQGLVSAVLFRNRALRPALAGIPRMSSFQMNVRIYTVDPVTQQPGSVFFHGLYVSRVWQARVCSALFGVTFQHLPVTVSTRREGHHLVNWHAEAPDHRVAIDAREVDISIDADALDLLTNPHTGYVIDRHGVLRRWSIWHRAQQVHTMVVDRASVACLADLHVGTPVSALYVESVDYQVYLPPHSIPKAIPPSLSPRSPDERLES